MRSYTLKVYPKGGYRTAYRVFRVGGNTTLDKLHDYILMEFDFDFDHLYEFCSSDNPYSRGCICVKPGGNPSTSMVLDEMNLFKGQKFYFHYDFGDDWLFTIHVQAVEEGAEDGDMELLKSKGIVKQYPSWEDED